MSASADAHVDTLLKAAFMLNTDERPRTVTAVFHRSVNRKVFIYMHGRPHTFFFSKFSARIM